MIFARSCPACVAKDDEIGRLTAQLAAATARIDKQSDEVLELARDATGHSRRAVPMDPPLPPLPELVQSFLDYRFGYGTPLWRQQVREARRLLATGMAELEVNERLSRGKNLDDII